MDVVPWLTSTADHDPGYGRKHVTRSNAFFRGIQILSFVFEQLSSSIEIALGIADAFFGYRGNGIQILRFRLKRLNLFLGLFECEAWCGSFCKQHLLALVSSRCSLVVVAYATRVGRSARGLETRGRQR